MQKLATERGTSMWAEDPGALSNPTSTSEESLPHSHHAKPWAQGESLVPQSDPESLLDRYVIRRVPRLRQAFNPAGR